MPTLGREKTQVRIISAEFSATTGSSITASLPSEEEKDSPRIRVIPTATVLLVLEDNGNKISGQGTAIGDDVLEAIFLATKRALENCGGNIIGNCRLRGYTIEEGELGSFAIVMLVGKNGKKTEGVAGVDTPGKGLEIFFDALVEGLTKLLEGGE